MNFVVALQPVQSMQSKTSSIHMHGARPEKVEQIMSNGQYPEIRNVLKKRLAQNGLSGLNICLICGAQFMSRKMETL